jgi:nucleotide-binding universal stress UspA family protein
MSEAERTVVVGIAEGQADAVALVAAEFAAQFDADLVCAVVDEAHYTTTDRTGRPVFAPIDPDGVDTLEEDWSAIDAHLHEVLDRVTTRWTVRFITGEPSAALAALADEVGALMIVIGTRRRTVARSVRELFAGSIAAHLAHRQARPVLVVPLDPAPPGQRPPWQHPAEEDRR